MWKKTVSVIVIMALLSVLTAFAESTPFLEAYVSDIKIILNGEQVDFNLPVVTIDGNTYIPLRESAEKIGVGVGWDNENREILILSKGLIVDAKKIFQELFYFYLPETAEVLNYDHSIAYGDRNFAAKISFDAKDLPYMKSNLQVFGVRHSSEDTEHEMEKTIFELACATGSRWYGWWDLSKYQFEDVLVYESYKSGVEVKTIKMEAFIAKDVDG